MSRSWGQHGAGIKHGPVLVTFVGSGSEVLGMPTLLNQTLQAMPMLVSLDR